MPLRIAGGKHNHSIIKSSQETFLWLLGNGDVKHKYECQLFFDLWTCNIHFPCNYALVFMDLMNGFKKKSPNRFGFLITWILGDLARDITAPPSERKRCNEKDISLTYRLTSMSLRDRAATNVQISCQLLVEFQVSIRLWGFIVRWVGFTIWISAPAVTHRDQAVSLFLPFLHP